LRLQDVNCPYDEQIDGTALKALASAATGRSI
jgi:hypothetical protein